MIFVIKARYIWKGKEKIFSISTPCDHISLDKMIESFKKYLVTWSEANGPILISLEMLADFSRMSK